MLRSYFLRSLPAYPTAMIGFGIPGPPRSEGDIAIWCQGRWRLVSEINIEKNTVDNAGYKCSTLNWTFSQKGSGTGAGNRMAISVIVDGEKVW